MAVVSPYGSQSKKVVDTKQQTELVAHDVVAFTLGGRASAAVPVGITFEDIPIEQEAFEVTFYCHHCDYKWTETVTKIEKGE